VHLELTDNLFLILVRAGLCLQAKPQLDDLQATRFGWGCGDSVEVTDSGAITEVLLNVPFLCQSTFFGFGYGYFRVMLTAHQSRC
jgi:hypothetical protein